MALFQDISNSLADLDRLIRETARLAVQEAEDADFGKSKLQELQDQRESLPTRKYIEVNFQPVQPIFAQCFPIRTDILKILNVKN